MMGKYIRHFLYIIRHKWFVFWECLKLGVPLWAAIIHDWQRFMPAEFRIYAINFFGPWKKDDRPQWLIDVFERALIDAFERAWLHHLYYGPHHWDYWLDRENKALEIPERYWREMVADWRGAGRAISGKDDAAEWYARKRDEIILHPKTREWVEHELGVAFAEEL